MDLAALIVSIVVAIGAYIGWNDSKRRTNALERSAAVKFVIEPESGPNRYRLRNVGDKRAEWVDIDGSSVKEFPVSSWGVFPFLDPNQSFGFGLTPADGRLPDTITVVWSAPFKGSQAVQFPQDALRT